MSVNTISVRIGGGNIWRELSPFVRSVEAAASQKKEEDEILLDAPDEFLDPIMSTLMTDPVILPSAGITIDRQTIARSVVSFGLLTVNLMLWRNTYVRFRHLLSDQTDPFNRLPLTMDMVTPDTKLQRRIQEWVQQKKEEKAKNRH